MADFIIINQQFCQVKTTINTLNGQMIIDIKGINYTCL